MIDPTINFLAIAVAAIIPNALGALFYGPLFGSMWRASLGKTSDDLEPNNPVLVYGGAFLLSFIMAFFINIVIQFIHKDVTAAGELVVASHNTFGHGALHGAMIGLTFLMPVIVSLGLFHKAHWKTNLLNSIFWVICFALMAGVIDVWT